MNSAYKHLDTKLKVADLTIGQWLGLALGVAIAIVWGFYLSPLGMLPTAGTAVYIGAIPAGLALMSAFYEVELWLVMRSAVRWRRSDGRFVPGPGPDTHGYVVREDQLSAPESGVALSNLDLTALWES
jgi:hypothetical protein